jgi:hypothetical protein
VDRKDEFTAKQLACIEFANAHEWDFDITEMCQDINISRQAFYQYLDHSDFKQAWDGAFERYMTLQLPGVYAATKKTAKKGGVSGVMAARLIGERFDDKLVPKGQTRIAGADGTPLKAYIDIDPSAVIGKPADDSSATGTADTE